MRFPNAAKGVKKIFVAGIFSLIAACIIMITEIVVSAYLMGFGDSSLGWVLFRAEVLSVIGFYVFAIVCIIMNILGLSGASKDEAFFKKALICLLIGVVTVIIGFLLPYPYKSQKAVDICKIVFHIMGMAATLLTVIGIMKLSDKMHDEAAIKNGRLQLKLIGAIYCVSIVCNVIYLCFGGSSTDIVRYIVMALADVFYFIQNLLFVIFLSKAKRILSFHLEIMVR